MASLLIVLCCSIPTLAEDKKDEAKQPDRSALTPPVELTAQADHKRLMELPVILKFGFGGRGFGPSPGARGPTCQEQLIAKGWGYAIIVPNSIQADNGAGLTRGIIGLCNKGQPRQVDDWGALRAWAWGASRALDYFETDKSVDSKRVGLEGMSRYGKAAIVTQDYDKRFAIGVIASSGDKTINRKAGCRKPASPVRRAERLNSISCSYRDQFSNTANSPSATS